MTVTQNKGQQDCQIPTLRTSFKNASKGKTNQEKNKTAPFMRLIASTGQEKTLKEKAKSIQNKIKNMEMMKTYQVCDTQTDFLGVETCPAHLFIPSTQRQT